MSIHAFVCSARVAGGRETKFLALCASLVCVCCLLMCVCVCVCCVCVCDSPGMTIP